MISRSLAGGSCIQCATWHVGVLTDACGLSTRTAMRTDLQTLCQLELSMRIENGTLLGGLEIGTRHPSPRGGSGATYRFAW